MSEPGSPPSPWRWTGLAYLLLGAGALLLLLGVALRSSVPIFVALPFLLAPLAAAVVGPRGGVRARLSWGAFGAAGEVRVVGELRAEPSVDLTDAVLEFPRPADLDEVAPPRVDRRRDVVRFDLRWRAPYPTISVVEPPTILWRDPAGLVERPVDAPTAPIVVERYPAELLRLGSVRLDRVLPFPGEVRSRQLGSSGEFYGLREAEPTDPPRRINWRATARLGRRMVNECQLDRTGDVLVLVDTRPARLGVATDEILLGVARAAAVGIVNAFSREKARIGYAAFGEFVDPVPLSSGRGHRLRLREAIRATRVARISGPSERCSTALSRYFPPGLTTILISSLTGDADTDLVPYLRRHGYPTIVLSPSPHRVQPPGPGLAPADEAIAERLDRLARRQVLSRVWSQASVVDWEDLWSLGAFVRLLKEPGRRRSV